MFLKKSLVVAAFMAFLPWAAQAGQTINVAVAANFSSAMNDIATAYKTATGNTVTFTTGATSDLETAIINGAGNSAYDLFLAANSAAPADLYNNHNSLVLSGASPFTYAKGTLELWSNDDVDVSAGLPATGNIAIANPATAPYGYAASQVLSGTYGITLPNSRVTQYTDITVTKNAIANHNPPMGFVAKSQICTDGQYTAGGTHHTYTSGYDPIVQNGVKLARSSRTAAQTAALNNFVTYLTSNSTALAKITKYCYDLP